MLANGPQCVGADRTLIFFIFKRSPTVTCSNYTWACTAKLTQTFEKWHWTLSCRPCPSVNMSSIDWILSRHSRIITWDHLLPCKHFICGILWFHLKNNVWYPSLCRHPSYNCLICQDPFDLTHWYCRWGTLTCKLKVLELSRPQTYCWIFLHGQ